MNAKIERTIAEIGRTKDKIAEFQAKLRALEQQKISQENEEIVALFRKEKFTEADLQAYINAKRGADSENVNGAGGENGGAPPANAGPLSRYETGLPAPGEEDAENED